MKPIHHKLVNRHVSSSSSSCSLSSICSLVSTYLLLIFISTCVINVMCGPFITKRAGMGYQPINWEYGGWAPILPGNRNFLSGQTRTGRAESGSVSAASSSMPFASYMDAQVVKVPHSNLKLKDYRQYADPSGYITIPVAVESDDDLSDDDVRAIEKELVRDLLGEDKGGYDGSSDSPRQTSSGSYGGENEYENNQNELSSGYANHNHHNKEWNFVGALRPLLDKFRRRDFNPNMHQTNSDPYMTDTVTLISGKVKGTIAAQEIVKSPPADKEVDETEGGHEDGNEMPMQAPGHTQFKPQNTPFGNNNFEPNYQAQNGQNVEYQSNQASQHQTSDALPVELDNLSGHALKLLDENGKEADETYESGKYDGEANVGEAHGLDISQLIREGMFGGKIGMLSLEESKQVETKLKSNRNLNTKRDGISRKKKVQTEFKEKSLNGRGGISGASSGRRRTNHSSYSTPSVTSSSASLVTSTSSMQIKTTSRPTLSTTTDIYKIKRT